MNEYLPILIVGAIIGSFAVFFIVWAVWTNRSHKCFLAPGFSRRSTDFKAP